MGNRTEKTRLGDGIDVFEGDTETRERTLEARCMAAAKLFMETVCASEHAYLLYQIYRSKGVVHALNDFFLTFNLTEECQLIGIRPSTPGILYLLVNDMPFDGRGFSTADMKFALQFSVYVQAELDRYGVPRDPHAFFKRMMEEFDL